MKRSAKITITWNPTDKPLDSEKDVSMVSMHEYLHGLLSDQFDGVIFSLDGVEEGRR